MAARNQTSGLWLQIASWSTAVLAGVVILLTIASAVPSNQWWIRLWDFPRLIIFTAGLLLLLALFTLRFRGRGPLAIVLFAALAYQAGHIYPYTIFSPVEAEQIEIAGTERRAHCFTILSLNVLQDNRDFARTRALIERVDPDILLLMEADQRWLDAVESQLAGYPYRLEAPLSNTYGMIFATRLPMTGGRLLNLAEIRTPSAHAVLRTRSGRPFRLAALHPRPPHPGQDTEERDAEIAIAAMMIRESGLPALTLGDFNDVGWSETSQLFRRLGRYIDPRIGRGFYATFPASLPAFRWPLDHIFFTEDFGLVSLQTGDPIGSDHLPVRAEICLVPEVGQTLNAPSETEEDDAEDVAEVIEAYREDQLVERRTGEE